MTNSGDREREGVVIMRSKKVERRKQNKQRLG